MLPGSDLVGDGLLLGDHARELLDAPLVGLVEVDDGAEEVPRLQRVDLAADAVALSGDRLELALEEARPSSPYGGRGTGRRALELSVRSDSASSPSPAFACSANGAKNPSAFAMRWAARRPRGTCRTAGRRPLAPPHRSVAT
jgi:hypothetical protein